MWRIDSHMVPSGKWLCQDRIVIREMRAGGIAAALFDGNGKSNAVVDYCAEMLPRRLMELPLDAARGYILRSFADVAKEALKRKGGSTAAVACLAEDGRAFVAVLGDSLAIANIDGREIYVSPEHNVYSNIREREAAQKRGATYLPGNRVIEHHNYLTQLGRAFGLCEMNGAVSSVPDINEMELRPGNWLALMSDGVLNPAGDTYTQDRKMLISLVDRGATASEIIRIFTKRREIADDASMIICRFFPQAALVTSDVPKPYLLADAKAPLKFERERIAA